MCSRFSGGTRRSSTHVARSIYSSFRLARLLRSARTHVDGPVANNLCVCLSANALIIPASVLCHVTLFQPFPGELLRRLYFSKLAARYYIPGLASRNTAIVRSPRNGVSTSQPTRGRECGRKHARHDASRAARGNHDNRRGRRCGGSRRGIAAPERTTRKRFGTACFRAARCAPASVSNAAHHERLGCGRIDGDSRIRRCNRGRRSAAGFDPHCARDARRHRTILPFGAFRQRLVDPGSDTTARRRDASGRGESAVRDPA